METPPQFIAGRYRVIRELGRGGMGVVYVVEHLGTGDVVAMKVLLNHARATPEMIERFKREARAPAKVKSEHVVKITDTDVAPELDGAPFMVMELLDGRDVEKALEERGRFAPHEVVHILRQAASALDKAHALGITHRDLKPENIFLHRRESGEEVVKILDFGISKMAGESANDISGAGLTRTGAMMGTPLYMSPEQARGRVLEIGPPTDIWAIGLIAYRLLTGKVYWEATTIAELMVQIISDPILPPSTRTSGLPPSFDAWFARSMNRDPQQRYTSVGEQIRELAASFGLQPIAFSGSDTSGALRVSATSIAPSKTVGAHTTAGGLAASSVREPPRKRSPIPLVLAGLLLVGGVGAVVTVRMSSNDSAKSNAAAPTTPTTEETSPKPRDLKPMKTTEPEPESAAPVIAPAAATTAKPAAATPAKSAAPKSSASVGVAVKTVAPPEPMKPVEAKPPPAAPPLVVDTAPKKYDPAAP